jgi:orotate phosphoribosyltransferase
VDTGVTALARPQPGHFDLGTGYHGDLWLDLDALFLRPARLQPHIRRLAGLLRGHSVDAVCGPMEGGAFLALALATELDTTFLPAYRAPTPDGQPPAFRLPDVRGGITGWRVALADDAVNAGTAVQACVGQLRDHGAVPVAVAALLSLGGASTTMPAVLGVPFYATGTIESQAWPSASCPLCAAGTPLVDPVGPVPPG